MTRQSTIPAPEQPELVLAVLRGAEKLEVLVRRHQVSAPTRYDAGETNSSPADVSV